MELNDKLLEKAKNAKTVEELVAVAKENGVELTAEEAKTYFANLNAKEGELSDDELDNVSGGGKCGTIYKDNRPVVTVGNTCDLWRCEKDHSRKRNKGCSMNFDTCIMCGALAVCSNCEYSHSESGLLLCYHPDRYDN